jgi:transposase
VRQEVALLQLLEPHVTELNQRIEALYTRLQPSDVLRSIPGLGDRLAPVILGLIHTANRFRGERHLRGFCGLFPKHRSSGGVERPGQRVTKSGPNRIKRALYLAADAARRVDPQLAEVYWRLMVRKGHHHRQALCAVATRLINRILSVLKSGRPYILRDLDGQPITLAQARQIIAARFVVPEEVRRSRRRQQIAA